MWCADETSAFCGALHARKSLGSLESNISHLSVYAWKEVGRVCVHMHICVHDCVTNVILINVPTAHCMKSQLYFIVDTVCLFIYKICERKMLNKEL